MSDHQKVIATTRARIGAVLGLRATVAALSVWMLVWGTLVLVLRGAFYISREPLLVGLVGVVAILIAGVVIAIRRRPSVDTVRAMLDSHWQCGGLLMSSAADLPGAGAAGANGSDSANGSNWPITVPASPVPRISWQARRPCGILLASTAFLVVSFLIPSRFLDELTSQRLVVGAEVKKLAEKVEVLKEEKILPPQRAESLEMALEQLQREASGNAPAKTLEAMDQLEQQISKASAEAAEAASRNAQKAARAEELAAAIEKALGEVSAQELSEAMNVLSKDVQKALEENAALAGEISNELKEALEKGDLTPQQLADLSEAMGKCKGNNLGKLGKLGAGRMLDPSALEKMQSQCEIDPEALAKALCKCQGNNEALLNLCQNPGKGGVDRGRADAAMTWNDGANREEVDFKDKPLPPGAMASLRDSQLQGVSIGDPTAGEPAAESTGGALDAASAGRGSARTQVILPEHKKIVQRFFARENTGKAQKSSNPTSASP